MGSFRLALAICVLLSHAGVSIRGWNQGVVAVISFYLISGYVMTLLIKKHYATADRVADFYLDRAARLFPQYLFYLAATGLLIAAVRVSSPFLGGCDALRVGMNLIILPLDLFQFQSLGIATCMMIPQAWSLGLEMSFYLLAPAIVLLPKLTRWLVAGSLCVFALAYLGIIDTDMFGYRLLPGVLFIFVVGAACVDGSLLGGRFPALVWFGALLLLVGLFFERSLFGLLYSKEVLLGLVVGIPALAFLRWKRFSDWDERLGNLSYGVFLNHFFCMWLMQALLGLHQPTRIRHFVLLVALSLALSVVSYSLVELPALKWRRAVRYRSTRQS